MPIGSFPGIDYRTQTVRAEINPLDKSTVISIFPKRIEEIKHTLQPGKFVIEAGSYEKPALLVVGSSSWWREVDVEQPLLEIPVSSIQIAESIVRDYCVGYWPCDMQESRPGLFFLPGEINPVRLHADHKGLLDKARVRQKNWYMRLVGIADALWSRTNGNPLAISDDMRLAARELGLNAKEWLADFQNLELIRCIACGSMRNPLYPVCPTCKAVVDEDLAKKFKIKFAE